VAIEVRKFGPDRSAQLDPFLLPSPTGPRFALLIAAVLSVTCIIYVMLHNALPSNWERRMALSAQCEAIADPIKPNGLRDAYAGGELRDQCMAPANRAQGYWAALGVALLGAVTFGLYWTAPARKLRKDRLEPLSAEDAPVVLAALAMLCLEAGLKHTPSFVWSPTNAAESGAAFGRRGRYYVALSGGLVKRFYTDRPAFRAIVLHELAHLYNRDIDRTYLTVASWQAFVWVALVPLLIVQLLVVSEHALALAWRLLGLTVLVLLTRNEVLRTREYYADLRAVRWDGSSGALLSVLARASAAKAGRRWAKPWAYHPTGVQRSSIVHDQTPLFRPQFMLSAITGATAMVGIRGGAVLFNDLFVVRLGGWFEQMDPGELSMCITFGGLTAFVIGSDLWESGLLSASGRKGPEGGWRAGCGLALGLLLGSWLDVTATVTATLVGSLLGVACWATLTALVSVVLTKCFADAVHAWLVLGGRRVFLDRARVLSLAIYAALLGLWLAALVFAQFAIVSSQAGVSSAVAKLEAPTELQELAPILPLLLTGSVLMSGAAPILMISAVGLVPFLVSLGTARGRPGSDAIVTVETATNSGAMHPWRAVLLGLAAGLAPMGFAYLDGGSIGVLLALGSMGLSLPLVAAVAAAAWFVARKAHLLAWSQAATSGMGAGSCTWAALVALRAALLPESETTSAFDALAFTALGWLTIGIGLLMAPRRTIPALQR
jgi:Zn-dependent protease with chaperone function